MRIFNLFKYKKFPKEPIISSKKKDYKTQSTNPNVLEIYKIILDNENLDSDYWNEEHGSQDLLRILEVSFSKNDWKDLELDLNNWSTNQLELFTQGILGGARETGTVIYYPSIMIQDRTITIPYRFDLLFTIIGIENGRQIKHKDLSYQIIENLEFINDNFDVLLNCNHKYLMRVKNILELLDLVESNDERVIDLKNKIQKASR